MWIVIYLYVYNYIEYIHIILFLFYIIYSTYISLFT